jgi:hypothetical protein
MWCSFLTDEQCNARPAGLAPVSFHVLHIARSLDRLLTYGEGSQLSQAQLLDLRSELDPGATRESLFTELNTALECSTQRVLALGSSSFEALRTLGKKQLHATLGGILVHVADHAQRHVGQAIIISKLLSGGWL